MFIPSRPRAALSGTSESQGEQGGLGCSVFVTSAFIEGSLFLWRKMRVSDAGQDGMQPGDICYTNHD